MPSPRKDVGLKAERDPERAFLRAPRGPLVERDGDV